MNFRNVAGGAARFLKPFNGGPASMDVTPVSEPSARRFTPAVFSAISQPKRSAKVHGWLGGHLQERSMCDYSLHAVATRPAEVAETLVSTKFKSTTTRGFASPGNPQVAVCLRPGTELAFENDVQTGGFLFRKKIGDRLARFRQIAFDQPSRHHDALEFSNGAVVLVTDLAVGQRATVLQLPASPMDEKIETPQPTARYEAADI
jgi:hypothetical protein